jgi:hypothetical protein
MSAPRFRPAGDKQTRGSLTGCVQAGRGEVQDRGHTLTVMSNMYGSPAGPAGGPGPARGPDPYAPYSPAPGRRKRLIRWGVGITLAGFLAGGGIALALSGGSNPAAAGSTASQVQGTTLNSELNAASTSSAASLPRLRRALARLRALGGVDGEFTFHNSTGFHTLAFERGAIQSVNGSTVVVRAPDGTIWSWQIVSDTVVRQSGHKTTTSALATGQTVFVGGPVINGAKDARLIVIRPGSSGSSSSSSVSGPSGTSVS